MTATRNQRILSVQPVGDGGGSEHALIGMIRQLTADGWECHVVVPGPARLASEYAAAGAVLHYLAMPSVSTSGGRGRWLRYAALWPVTVARLARLARGLRISVVHTNSLHSWYGWAVAALLRRPHVWHAREIVFQSGAALRLERVLVHRFAFRVIAISQAVADQLDPANVVVIFDDADLGRFGPERAGTFRAGAGIDDRVPLAGSVARLDTWKGFDDLLAAWPDVRRVRPDAELVVAGGPVPGKEDYAAGLRNRAASMPGVHWLGLRSDIPDVMADLDVFVQVSSEPEPFGLVVVEALACGCPVVAGDQGGPLEILGAEAARQVTPRGRLVPARDPLALAGAMVGLLPDHSDLGRRRSRPRLRHPGGPRFAPVFEAALESRR